MHAHNILMKELLKISQHEKYVYGTFNIYGTIKHMALGIKIILIAIKCKCM